MVRKGQEIHAYIAGIGHIPTERALRALNTAIEARIDATDDLADRLDDVEGGVTAVTKVTGVAPISVTPTVGNVVVSIDPTVVLGTGIAGRSTRFTGVSTIGNGAFLDDGTNASIAGNLTLSTFTQGSVLFAGAGGLVSQDNANLFWDDSNNRFGIGTSSPANTLDVRSSASTDVGRIQSTVAGGFSSLGYFDNGGTGRSYLGYGNASAPDTSVRSRNYWSLHVNDLVLTRTNSSPSTVAFYLNATNGNATFGTDATDPGVKLRVQSSTAGRTLSVDNSGGACTQHLIGSAGAPGYTGYVVSKGTNASPTQLWFIGRDGTGNTDGLIFRRASATDDFKIDTSGNFTYGAASGTTHQVNGFVGIGTSALSSQQLRVLVASGRQTGVSVNNINTASTLTDVRGLDSQLTGTHNTTAAAATVYSVIGVSTGTRSAGANSLTNVGVYAFATGGQDNIGLWVNSGRSIFDGNVALSGTNSLSVGGALTVDGNCTLGDSTTGDTHTINGRANQTIGSNVAIAHSLACSATGQTAVDQRLISASHTGSFDTTSAAATNYGVLSSVTSSRSAGANSLTNIALYGTAQNGQTNLAIYTAHGDVWCNVNSGSFIAFGNSTLGSGASNIHQASGRFQVQGTTYASIFNYEGGATEDTYVRGGKAASVIRIGDVNTGGVQIGATGNATTVLGSLAVDGNCTLGNASGDVHAVNGDLTISGLATTADPDTGYNLLLRDETVMALGVGGSLLLQGKYTAAGAFAGGGGIKLHKTNGTDGNFAFDLAFYTRANGGSVAEAVRIHDDKDVTFQGALQFAGAGIITSGAGTGIGLTAGTTVSINTGPINSDAEIVSSRDIYLDGTVKVQSSGGSARNMTVGGNLTVNGNANICDAAGDTLKFHGGTGAAQQTVTGSRGGNAALADLLTKLATLGLIVDGTTA